MINIPPTHPNVLIFKLRLKLVYRKSIISGICKPKKPVSWDSFVWLTLPSCCHRYRNIWLHKQQPTPGEPSIQKLGQLDPNSSSSILMPLRNWVAVKILLMTAGRIFAQVKLGTLRKINCRNRFILHSIMKMTVHVFLLSASGSSQADKSVGLLPTGGQTAGEWKPKLICCPAEAPVRGFRWIPNGSRNSGSSWNAANAAIYRFAFSQP